jgi:hypothetical protein
VVGRADRGVCLRCVRSTARYVGNLSRFGDGVLTSNVKCPKLYVFRTELFQVGVVEQAADAVGAEGGQMETQTIVMELRLTPNGNIMFRQVLQVNTRSDQFVGIRWRLQRKLN